ncbi:putative glycosidase C21B10.07 [Psilocybe cubensis]|uniref:GH16 domain-containing protein n=2 Tax=Psilocybe cubensis TaxID=181762 RepID=A0A8H8CKD7_PSICU|nr:putative glycosidase C21B10.07 [Psilocybe cubensis]KAH9482063.1 putative glycosidase C21B10.07 [Psilocybe cubensis]
MYGQVLAGLLLASASVQAAQKPMQLALNYSGDAFFDLWNYKVGDDFLNWWGDPSNNGIVNFTDQAFARQQNLLFVNSVGNVIVKTDNFTDGTGNASFVRNSLQLLSKDPITPGTLMIMDAVHMPFGCAVWPAFWMNGGANWPSLGEIDIVENINLATTNAYNLHTANGCKASTDVAITGDLISTDCFNVTNHDQGCKVQDTTLSYGAGFAGNGGGAFAFLWDDEGMRIWFFPRPTIPADLSTASPNPDGWGTPTAFYPSSTCDTTKFFGPQTLILEINVCGNFAVEKFNQTCSAVAAQCTDVVPNPSAFDDAYFEIRYITVFSNSTVPKTNLTASGTSGSSTGTQSPGAQASTKSSGVSLNIPTSFSVLCGIAFLSLFFM